MTLERLEIQAARVQGLIDSAPFHAIKLAIDVAPNQEPGLVERLYVIAHRCTRENAYERLDVSPTVPMLLLAILTAFVGEDEARDARIAEVFDPHAVRFVLCRPLTDVLSRPWTTRDIIRILLRRIVERSKSQALTDAVQSIDPTIVSNPATSQAERVPGELAR